MSAGNARYFWSADGLERIKSLADQMPDYGGPEDFRDLLKYVDILTRVRPMIEAPQDGSCVLGFIKGNKYPTVVYYGVGKDGAGCDFWRDREDGFPFHDEEMLGWVPCPTYI